MFIHFRTTTEDYVDYKYIEVDPECPDTNAVCCNGYVYYPYFRQCLSMSIAINKLSFESLRQLA